MNVLIAAAACRPGAGSEWHVGWQTVMSASQRHRVEVITQPFNRTDISEWLREHPSERTSFHYVGRKVRWSPHRLLARMQDWVELRRWTAESSTFVRGLVRQKPLDLGHHATIATWRMPSPLAGAGLPWVWGPVGGGASVPPSFYPLLSPPARFFEMLRAAANRLALRSARLRFCAQDASVILTNSEETARLLRRLRGRSEGIRELSQSFLTIQRLESLANPQKTFPEPGQEVRLLACGTLEGLKGVALSLRALAICAQEGLNFRFRFLGKGSELDHLHALTHRLGLDDRVRLGEWLEGDAFTQALRESHFYVAPSLREGVPVSLIEAMAAHCVPIVARCGGPGMVVTPESGFAIPLDCPKRVIAELARTILMLARDAGLCRQIAQAAHARIRDHFSEPSFLRGMEAAYSDAVGRAR